MKKSKKITARARAAIRHARWKRGLALLDEYCRGVSVQEMGALSTFPMRWVYLQ